MKTKLKKIKLTQENRFYSLPVPVIAISGGISSGKSTVSRILKEMGYPVLSADELVKDIYALPESIAFISSLNSKFVSNGIIDFKLLREEFFTHPESKLKVENWIYPRLENAFKKRFQKLSNPHFIFYEIPLLFEKKLHHLFDLNLLVYANPKLQLLRIQLRDNVSEESAQKILDAQMKIDEKKGLADVVIMNEEDEGKLKEEVLNFLQDYFI